MSNVLKSNEGLGDRLKKASQEMKVNKGTESQKLVVGGRLDRVNNEFITKSFYLPSDLDKKIKDTCLGSDMAIYNYLIYLGLKKASEGDGVCVVDVNEIFK